MIATRLRLTRGAPAPVGRRAPRPLARAVWIAALAAGAAAAAPEQGADGPTSTAPAAGTIDARAEAFRAALAAIEPCVVRIETIGGALPVRRSEGDERATTVFRQADGPTTGVVWSPDGYIFTSSFNFIRDPSIITVTLHDGRRLLARLVARDHPARLALLKVDPPQPLPTPRLVEPQALRPGQWALALGHGFGGERPALSVGIVSGLNRMTGLAVQTDAKTSPANYGGPLVDGAGALIGVCVPMGAGEDEVAGVEWYDSGISFAIHAGRLRWTFQRMRGGSDVHRGLMGVALDPTDADPRGVAVLGEPSGPAALAGLRAGDVITSIDGTATPTHALLRRSLAARAAGDPVRVGFLREGQALTADLVLARRAELDGPTSRPAESQPAVPQP